MHRDQHGNNRQNHLRYCRQNFLWMSRDCVVPLDTVGRLDCWCFVIFFSFVVRICQSPVSLTLLFVMSVRPGNGSSNARCCMSRVWHYLQHLLAQVRCSPTLWWLQQDFGLLNDLGTETIDKLYENNAESTHRFNEQRGKLSKPVFEGQKPVRDKRSGRMDLQFSDGTRTIRGRSAV